MNRLLLLLIGIFICSNILSQNQGLLDTYWKYRDRLRKDFVKIGNESGESIPAVAKRPGVSLHEVFMKK